MKAYKIRTYESVNSFYEDCTFLVKTDDESSGVYGYIAGSQLTASWSSEDWEWFVTNMIVFAQQPVVIELAQYDMRCKTLARLFPNLMGLQ